MLLSKEFKFDSAHNLIEYHGKCEKLHGHTYRLRVTIQGIPGNDGMILDYGMLKKIVHERIISRVDHNYLNDIVPQSTTENIVRWMWAELEQPLHSDTYSLFEIKLWETETSFVTYRGNENAQ